MNFASDNTAGVAPPILEALVKANAGFSLGYGNDDWTRRVEKRLSEVFERDVTAFLVPTGTAANALALVHVSPPWGAVFCHEDSHVAADECGAVEFFGGVKLIDLPGAACKLLPDTIREALTGFRGPPHSVTPSALTITQATEVGTVYGNAEVRALADLAHERGMVLHMDGARFANALVHLGCSPAEATWKAGVDVLSFGATKGGALAAEAVIFFDPARAAGMASRRKRAGLLISKHRFVATQIEAYLANDTWLALARHANGMAERLAKKLTEIGIAPVWPVQANELFVRLSKDADARLKAKGASYYPWPDRGLPQGMPGTLVRLVTSFATTAEEVEQFVATARAP
jgi:threonine aldolase